MSNPEHRTQLKPLESASGTDSFDMRALQLDLEHRDVRNPLPKPAASVYGPSTTYHSFL